MGIWKTTTNQKKVLGYLRMKNSQHPSLIREKVVRAPKNKSFGPQKNNGCMPKSIFCDSLQTSRSWSLEIPPGNCIFFIGEYHGENSSNQLRNVRTTLLSPFVLKPPFFLRGPNESTLSFPRSFFHITKGSLTNLNF